MTIAMMVDNPQGSEEVYEKVRAHMGLGSSVPPGGILQFAGPSPNGGWRVISVWESEDDARRFYDERVRPAFDAIGATAPGRPEIWPVHSVNK